MPIMREWRAEIRRALKDEYVAYVNATGMVEYRQTPAILAPLFQPATSMRSVLRSLP